MDSFEKIVSENKKRKDAFNLSYNPVTGEGSPLEREAVNLTELNATFYLPVSMLKVKWISDLVSCGSFTEYAKRVNYTSDDPVDDLETCFIIERFKHDFEFWAIATITIQNAESLEEFKFVLRKAQRKLLMAFENMRLAKVPIRIILLKAR
ncbi:MAG TPA: terminase, partial [Bacteroidales bacterium]|nr:terminase [Bacteroidales bacterium]